MKLNVKLPLFVLMTLKANLTHLFSSCCPRLVVVALCSTMSFQTLSKYSGDHHRRIPPKQLLLINIVDQIVQVIPTLSLLPQ